MGKSLYIQRLARDLKLNWMQSNDVHHVTVPLHGPVVKPDTVLEFFKDNMKNPTCCIYHIDIAPNVCMTKYLMGPVLIDFLNAKTSLASTALV